MGRDSFNYMLWYAKHNGMMNCCVEDVVNEIFNSSCEESTDPWEDITL